MSNAKRISQIKYGLGDENSSLRESSNPAKDAQKILKMLAVIQRYDYILVAKALEKAAKLGDIAIEEREELIGLLDALLYHIKSQTGV